MEWFFYLFYCGCIISYFWFIWFFFWNTIFWWRRWIYYYFWWRLYKVEDPEVQVFSDIYGLQHSESVNFQDFVLNNKESEYYKNFYANILNINWDSWWGYFGSYFREAKPLLLRDHFARYFFPEEDESTLDLTLNFEILDVDFAVLSKIYPIADWNYQAVLPLNNDFTVIHSQFFDQYYRESDPPYIWEVVIENLFLKFFPNWIFLSSLDELNLWVYLKEHDNISINNHFLFFFLFILKIYFVIHNILEIVYSIWDPFLNFFSLNQDFWYVGVSGSFNKYAIVPSFNYNVSVASVVWFGLIMNLFNLSSFFIIF